MLLHYQVLLHFLIKKIDFLIWQDGHNMSQREQFLVRRRCLGSLFPRNFVQSDKYFHKLRIWVVHRYDHMGFSYFSLDTILVHSVSVWLRNIKSVGLKLRRLINNWTIIVCFIGVVFSTTGLEAIIFFLSKGHQAVVL